MYIIAIDLGTTNVKFGLYDDAIRELCSITETIRYNKNNKFVEFDVDAYWEICKRGIELVIAKGGIDPGKVKAISLTGQAESLILLGSENRSLRAGISWLDERSEEECKILRSAFDAGEGYKITGQADVLTTWPITKMLWLKRNEQAVFDKTVRFLLLKDYIIYKLTGKFVAELSIYNFSYYLDIKNKKLWEDILHFVGVRVGQIPELIEPGEVAGSVIPSLAKTLGLSNDVQVNVGALDHFAGMIGTGNVNQNSISETTGTVLAIATLVDRPQVNEYRIPCHYGPLKNTYVLLSVCESGGISLEWAKQILLPDDDYAVLNKKIAERYQTESEIIFLPYLTGTSAPELNPRARGVFYGLKSYHDHIDLVRSVMEGVAYLLRKNIDIFQKIGINTERVVSHGGGAKSGIWNQIKADITEKMIITVENEEATLLGAAILASKKLGLYKKISEAVENSVRIKKKYTPRHSRWYENGYGKFLRIYKQLEPVFNE